ncbi:MAG TPA: aminoacyl-tRNA hydrolase [Patescibacteria group bacterium]|nr:aminoacyl-tRNA hydrolase [Patescibacteria group bacterium]
MSSISLLFGLGNPGARYQHTRHNIGLDTLASLAGRYRLSWEPVRGVARRAPWGYAGRHVLLMQSLTYMNVSGCALAACGDFEPGGMIAVCDDINLPLGRIRIRPGGGSGGHRGLESIIETLGTEEFPRLRMGIGAPEGGGDLSEYVLSAFDDEEQAAVALMVRMAVDALQIAVRDGLEEAMQRYNRKEPPPV